MKTVFFGLVFVALAAAAFAGCQQITDSPSIDSACCVRDNVYIPEDGDSTRGAYASCVADVAFELTESGQLSEEMGRDAVRIAANSEVNMPKTGPTGLVLLGLAVLGLIVIVAFMALGMEKMDKKK